MASVVSNEVNVSSGVPKALKAFDIISSSFSPNIRFLSL